MFVTTRVCWPNGRRGDTCVVLNVLDCGEMRCALAGPIVPIKPWLYRTQVQLSEQKLNAKPSYNERNLEKPILRLDLDQLLRLLSHQTRSNSLPEAI
jgi:hypothetical protein